MLESFVIVLREGVEAALVVAVLMAALRKAGREDLYVRVGQALAAAVGLSVVGGVALRSVAVSEEVFEGALMLLAAVFVASMMWWIGRASRHLRADVEARIASVGKTGGGATIFLLTLLLVTREGIEAVVFLSAASLDSELFSSLLGGALGLALAVGFGIAFARGSLRIDLARFFRVTGFVLGLLLFQLFVGGLHEFAEAGLIPVGPREMGIIGPIVKNNVLFVLALLLTPWFVLATAPKPSEGTETAGPEARLKAVRERRERIALRLSAALSTAILAVLTVSFVKEQAGRKLSPAESVAFDGGDASIPLSALADGRLHRFVADVDGAKTRFILIRSGGKIGSAFDACELCGTDGYNQRGEQVICLHCDAEIAVPTIGRGGGCNPLPLPAHVEGDRILVRAADLRAKAALFRSSP